MSKEVKTKRIRIIKQTTVNGKPARVDDVVDTNVNDANYLIGAKHAVEAPDEKLASNGKAKPTAPAKKDDKAA